MSMGFTADGTLETTAAVAPIRVGGWWELAVATVRISQGIQVETHQPVLLEETLRALAVRPSGCYVDATFGRGGHSRAILARLGPEGRLLGIDRDPGALAAGRQLQREDRRFAMEGAGFSRLGELLGQYRLTGSVHGILLDLGVSSPQLDSPERGFSFLREGPLDMRMDPRSEPSARQWLNQASDAEIARVLKVYGEERFAGRIARAIVRARAAAPLETTGRLAEIVSGASPSREPGRHPATRSFQAIRIHINRELEELRACLDQVPEILAPTGRLVAIGFHSLEDRMVKRFMRDQAQPERAPRGLPVTADRLRPPRLRLVGKPVRPSAREVQDNPRARSAVMRVAERLA